MRIFKSLIDEKKKNWLAILLYAISSSLIVGLLFIISTQVLFNKSKGLDDNYKYFGSKDMTATGLSGEQFEENRKIFSFKIQKLEIEKKKFGFYRLGFFKVAQMNGVEINFYFANQNQELASNESSIERYFLENDRIRALNLSKIKSLNIEKIVVNFFLDNKLVSSIKGDHADMDFRNKELFLYGNVEARSDDGNLLQCENIKWTDGYKRLETRNDYTLKQGSKISSGKGISCDNFLKHLQF